MADFREGPWYVEDCRGRANNMLRVVDGNGHGIARINAAIDADATARLIANAPKLFSVLSLVRAAYLLHGVGKPEVLADSTSIMAAIESALEAVEQSQRTEG